mgnify:CR=1 FL=1
MLDEGCEWHHPDIEANLWINHPEDINSNGRFDSIAAPAGDLDGIPIAMTLDQIRQQFLEALSRKGEMVVAVRAAIRNVGLSR